jgi:Flp pilus assembly protein TadD
LTRLRRLTLDYPGALDLLRQASELAPDNARYAYVYAVAPNSTGAQSEAMALLERRINGREVLIALIAIAQSAGDVATAFRHAREMAALYPADPQFRKLVSDLEKRQGH